MLATKNRSRLYENPIAIVGDHGERAHGGDSARVAARALGVRGGKFIMSLALQINEATTYKSDAELAKEKRNAAYLAEIDRRVKRMREGKERFVSDEELEALVSGN